MGNTTSDPPLRRLFHVIWNLYFQITYKYGKFITKIHILKFSHYIVIDEVQKIPELLNEVHRLI